MQLSVKARNLQKSYIIFQNSLVNSLEPVYYHFQFINWCHKDDYKINKKGVVEKNFR